MPLGERSTSPVIYAIAGFVGFWTILSVLFAAEAALGLNQPWIAALRGALTLWLPWICASPFMLLMAWLLPLGGVSLWKFVPGHLTTCLVLIFAAGWVSREVLPPPGQRRAMEFNGPPGMPPPPGAPPFAPGMPPPGAQEEQGTIANFLRGLPVGLPLYVAAILTASSVRLHSISREKEHRALELESQLSTARLQTLQSQLQPHFLFNTLNTLISTVHSDPDKAEDMLLNLSSLLRASLETQKKPLITFRGELDLARAYLSIQQTRYGKRLKTSEEIPLDTLSCALPPLILQPVIENAIKHAVEPNPEGASIFLKAQRFGDKVVLEVEDTGAGRFSPPANGHGIGVSNVRARLAAAFPGRPVGFDLLPNRHGGITARIEVPAQSSESPENGRT